MGQILLEHLFLFLFSILNWIENQKTEQNQNNSFVKNYYLIADLKEI